MNSQDLRYLQEAYLEIVMDEGYKERPVEKMKKKAMKIVDDPNYKGESETAWRHNHMFKHATKSARSREVAKRKSQKNLDKFYEKEDQYESFDIYDIILSHLLDEGYAETPEAAKVIMVNMSEEWRESIFEEMKELPVRKMDKKSKELTSKFLKSKPGSKEAKKLLSRSSKIMGTRDSKTV